jgi:hypothetical protein
VSPGTGAAGAHVPAGPAGHVRIDRLALRVAGLDEGAARALGRLVAEHLAAGPPRSAGAVGAGRLQVVVRPAADELDKPDLLARRIADEIGRALARGGPGGEAVP